MKYKGQEREINAQKDCLNFKKHVASYKGIAIYITDMNSKDIGSLQKSILAGRDCFIFLIILFLAVHWLQLGTLLIAILFSYFLLDKLSIVIKNRWLTIVVFSTLVLILCL